MDVFTTEVSLNGNKTDNVRYDELFDNKPTESFSYTGDNDSFERKSNGKTIGNGNTTENSDKTKHQTDKRSVLTKLTSDKEYRRKYFLTISLLCSFFLLGWSTGQAGPALLDLQHITNVSLEKASALFTSGSVGYLCGALAAGFMFDRMKNGVILSLVFVLGLGVSTALVPWMSVYAWMVFVHVIKGAVGGGIDTTGNALLFRSWGTDGKMFMQALHFGFALGGAVSPLAIAPFLLPDEDDVPAQTSYNVTIMPNSNFSVSLTTPSNTSEIAMDQEESILYIGFSISAGVAFLISIPILISTIQAHFAIKQYGTIKVPETDQSGADEGHSQQRPRTMSKNMKILVVFVLFSIFLPYVAVESSFSSFLSTFCVRELKWTKVNGALLTSTFWAAFAVGRLLGVVMTAVFSLVTLIFSYSAFLLVSFAAMLLSAWFSFDTGMWIFSPLLGLSMSVIFPCVFTWTEESFLPVTGFISSLLIVGSTIISSINPLLLGMLMDDYTNMWFIYLLLWESILLYGVLIIAYFLSKIISKPAHHVNEINVKDNIIVHKT